MWPNPFSPLDVFIHTDLRLNQTGPSQPAVPPQTGGSCRVASPWPGPRGQTGSRATHGGGRRRGLRTGRGVRCAPGPDAPPPTSAPAAPAALPPRRAARVRSASFLRKTPGFVSGGGGGARAAALKFLEPQPRPQRLPRDSTFAITVKYLDSLFLPFYLLQLIRVLLPFSV